METVLWALALTALVSKLNGNGGSQATPPAITPRQAFPEPRIVGPGPASLAVGASLDLGISDADGFCVLLLYFQPESVSAQYTSATILAPTGAVLSGTSTAIDWPGNPYIDFAGGLRLQKVAGRWTLKNRGANPIYPVDAMSGPYVGKLWAIVYHTDSFTIN